MYDLDGNNHENFPNQLYCFDENFQDKPNNINKKKSFELEGDEEKNIIKNRIEIIIM